MFKPISKTVTMVSTTFHGTQPKTTVTYTADFWEGPEAPHEKGRRVKSVRSASHLMGRWDNVSPNVSFFRELTRFAGV